MEWDSLMEKLQNYYFFKNYADADALSSEDA